VFGNLDSPLHPWGRGIAKGAEEVGDGAVTFLVSMFGLAMGDPAGVIALMKEQANEIADRVDSPVAAAVLTPQILNPFTHLFLNLGRAAEARADGDMYNAGRYLV